MKYITPRKAAIGLGASHTGTGHHWSMTVTAVALAVLTPLFLITMGGAIGLSRADLIAHFARPWPALITGLFLVIGMVHFIRGTRIMIDDYFQGGTRKAAIMISVAFGWLVIAATIFALARMTLGTALGAA